MEQFITFLTPARGDEFVETATEEEQRIVGEHFAYLKAATEAGTLILAGRTMEAPIVGICVFEASDREAAERFAQEDPAVREGVFLARVQPYAVALMRG